MNLKSIIFFIITVSTVLFPAEFYKLSELEHNEAKQDSGTVWVANPIPDVRMGPSETKTIDITDVFTTNPDTVAFSFDPFPISSNNSIVTGNLTYNESTGKIYLDLISKTVYGSAQVSVKVNTEFGSASDTLTVKVDDPDTEIFEWGTAYSFDPQNTFGSPTAEWIAALDFDLGSDTYLLQEIEFGYAWDGTAEWKIVPFDIIPGDTPIGDLYGTVEIDGGTPNYINVASATILTGRFAVVFKTTANFMSMDPAGNSDRTWIYPVGVDSLWVHPEDISADYAGAWYIRLFSKMFITVPQNISTSIDGDTLTVSWSAVTNALSYLVYHSDDPYSGFTYLGTTDQTSYPVNVTSATKKFYYIKASNQEMK